MAVRAQTENRRNRGTYGEALAAACLRQEGYELLARNYRCRFGEIDLIAKEQDVLCFVEVKLRGSTAFGLPSEAVDSRKQARILRTAEHWLSEQYAAGCELPSIRFDVVELYDRHSGKVQYRILRNAFMQGSRNTKIRRGFP